MKATRARTLGWSACLLLAAFLRLSGARGSIVGDEVAVNSPDAAFHTRRMLQTLQDFPHVPLRDPLLDWPHGAVVQWPPGFDLLGAVLALPTRDRRSALIAFAALPTVLGLLLVWATAAASRVVMPGRPFLAGLCAAFVVAVLPQSVSMARFANPDHHVAEALIMLALGTWSVWTCRALLEGPLTARRRLAIEAAATFACVAAHALFVGSSAYIAIATLPVAIANLIGWQKPRATWAVGAPGLLAGALLTALLYQPAVAAHGLRFDYVFTSYLQPLLAAVAGLGCAVASAAGFILTLDKRRALLGASAFAGVLALAAVALAAHPATAALRHGVHEWFGGGNELLTGTTESVPLFAGTRFWEPAFWARCHTYYGVFGLLAPVFFAVAVAACLARGGLRASFPFLIWTFCIVAMALYQNRFGRPGLVNLAIAVSLALAYAAERLPRLRTLFWLFPLAAFALDPVFHHYLAVDGPQPLPPAQEASAYLRAHARPAEHGRRAGVLTEWDQSHFIVRYAERPVTATGFGFYIGGDVFDRVQKLWIGSETELLRFMDERDLGYVVQGATGYASRVLHGRGAFERGADGRTMLNAEYFTRLPLSPLLLAGTGFSALGVRHLEHLLPLHASTTAFATDWPLPVLFAYERVPGVTLRGRAAPGAVVQLRVPLRARGFAAEHEAWTRAGADGRFRLVTPLPTSYHGDGLATGTRARLVLGDRVLEQVIAEQQVRSGAVIDIPDAPP